MFTLRHNSGDAYIKGKLGIGITSPSEALHVNGTAKVTKLKIGSITLEEVNGALHIDKGVYSDLFVSARGSDSSSGGGGGSAFGLYSDWKATPSTADALRADLGKWLYDNKLNATDAAVTYLSKTDALNTYQPKGNYLTAITKTQIEAELTGKITSHYHTYIQSSGLLNPQTGRTQALGDVYSYNTGSNQTGAPTMYTSVIGFGRNTLGTIEIAGGWVSTMGLWYRALRDTINDWFDWVRILDTKCYGDYVIKSDGSNGTATSVTALLKKLGDASANVTDTTKFITSDIGGDSGTLQYWRRPATSLWNYIQGKADNRFLKLSGGTLKNGAVDVPFQIDTDSTTEIGMRLKMSGTSKGWVGYHPTYGTNLYNYACKKYLGLQDNGTLVLGNSSALYNVWHSGNDGAGSGLDADLLDGLDESSFCKMIKHPKSDTPDLFRFVGYAYSGDDSSFWYTTGPAMGFGGNSNYYKLFQGPYNANRLLMRTNNNGTYTDWREFAFLDSNVASATRLQTTTKYTAWGQTYFENGVPKFVSGDMAVNGSINDVVNIIPKTPFVGSIGSRGGAFEHLFLSKRLFFYRDDTPATQTKDGDLDQFGMMIDTTKLDFKIPGGFSGATDRPDQTVKANGISIHAVRNNSMIGSVIMAFGIDGNIALGTYPTDVKFDVRGTARITGKLHLATGTGAYLAYNPTSNAIQCSLGFFSNSFISARGADTSSDIRLKTDIRPLCISLDDIAEAPAVTFRWKDSGEKSFGSIAQYWEDIVPEAVHERGGGKSLAYAALALDNSIIIARELREVKIENEKLRERIKTLENANDNKNQ